jgi:hypothetical protein
VKLIKLTAISAAVYYINCRLAADPIIAVDNNDMVVHS